MNRIFLSFLIFLIKETYSNEPFQSQYCPKDKSLTHPCSCGQFTSYPLPSLFCNSTELTVRKLRKVLDSVTEIDSFNHLQILNGDLKALPRNIDGDKDFLAIMIGNSNVTTFDVRAFEGSFHTLETLIIKENRNLDSFDFSQLYNYEKLVALYMHDNGIKEVRGFPIMNHINTLLLQRNEISYIEPFARNEKLRYISFAENKIKEIPRNAFMELPMVAEVDLKYNQLDVIKEGTLHFNSKDMVSIVLTGCGIEKIEKDAISGINPHTIVDFTDNHIEVLYEDVFNPLIQTMWKNMGLIKLHGNPLKCSCSTFGWLSKDEEYLVHLPGAVCQDGIKLTEFLKDSCKDIKIEL
ncbi:carboxypeptidase N subunit 2-like [Artemia franciscana]